MDDDAAMYIKNVCNVSEGLPYVFCKISNT